MVWLLIITALTGGLGQAFILAIMYFAFHWTTATWVLLIAYWIVRMAQADDY